LLVQLFENVIEIADRLMPVNQKNQMYLWQNCSSRGKNYRSLRLETGERKAE
jgi:hypothetical protein